MNLPIQCWNEYDELKTVVVCSPPALEIPDQQTAENVQWLKPFDPAKIVHQFETLVQSMKQEGVQVIDYSEYLSQDDRNFNQQLVSRIFVRDLACAFGRTLLPGKAGTSMRKPEYVHSHSVFQEWWDERTFPIQANNKWNSLEYGDVIVLNEDAVLINAGLRTSMESLDDIQLHIRKAGFSEVGVIDLPRRSDTLHLDMNCNVAGERLLLTKNYLRYFPIEILDGQSRYCMFHEFIERHGFTLVWTDKVKNTVPDINFLTLNPETILVSKQLNKKIIQQSPHLRRKNLIEIEISELEKGGGGIRCMTLPLKRS
ncbi:arginine deiminase family protein [Halobacillus halophilus]|uniref:arginine deiminase family protein n=1 Tax=Halobacillus halophilus TaxID=1570 RepID=UPI001CD448CE|nr:arginine deiminase family protein [Halobacillus halophilus]MCA1011154.1 arginine deiminase [Halobacillus halophilus]